MGDICHNVVPVNVECDKAGNGSMGDVCHNVVARDVECALSSVVNSVGDATYERVVIAGMCKPEVAEECDSGIEVDMEDDDDLFEINGFDQWNSPDWVNMCQEGDNG